MAEKRLKAVMERECTVWSGLFEELAMTKREIRRAKYAVGGIRVNGKQVRTDGRLYPGDVLEACLEERGGRRMPDARGNEEEYSENPAKEGPSLELLYEDGDLLVVNKPPGVVVHPVGCHTGDSLGQQVREYLSKKGECAPARLVGRLDKDTSGTLLLAKSQAAAARLWGQLLDGSLRKEYLAIASGFFDREEDVIRAPIGKAENDGAARMEVRPDGKRAVTHYRVLEQQDGAALLRLSLETGRTHQIRVHLSWAGHPLYGDSIYGKNFSAAFSRTALHAERLTFFQPFTKERIRVAAPMPQDMNAFWENVGGNEKVQEDFP